MTDISQLSGLEHVNDLEISGNQITSISSLTQMQMLDYVVLSNNTISDLRPLEENSGLQEGDYVYVYDNPLSDSSRSYWIPLLLARGVLVYYQ